jgi:hypothetical protein
VIADSVRRGAHVRGPSSDQTTGDPSLGGVEVPGAGVALGVMLPLQATAPNKKGSAFRTTSDSIHGGTYTSLTIAQPPPLANRRGLNRS